MKKLLGLIAVVCMMICLTLAAHAEIIDSGTCGASGDNLTWTLDDNGTLIISGTGDMSSFNYSGSVPWYSSKSLIRTVILADGVTSIGSIAFSDCTSLKSINIPNSVTTIGDYAFAYCSNLPSISIPNGVTTIGDLAFSTCYSLTSVIIPASVTTIGNEAFNYCGNLNISVDNTNETFCDIDGVLFSKDKKEILAYVKDELQPDYIIPNGVTSIGDYAFCGCSSLASISIPGSVTSIGQYAFSYCGKLNILVDNNNEIFCDIDGVLFSKDKKEILWYAKYRIQHEYTIPNGVTSIGDYAFYACTNLYSVNIPNGVTSIGDWAFGSCDNLPSINIPNSVISIGDYAFLGCKGLISISIPNSVTSIGRQAFTNCDGLKRIIIPNSVTSIGEYAFTTCTSLRDVYYSGSEVEWESIKIERGNECLTNAIIHYNSTGTPQTPVIDILSSTDGVYELKITLSDILYSCKLITVLYNDSNAVADWDVQNITSSDTEKTVTVEGENAKTVKIFIWDSLDGMRPLCGAAEMQIN